MKEKLSISFSGGRTSAYMTHMIMQNFAHEYDIQVVFANTGQEHPKTLDFVRKCDEHWGFNTVWLEAVVDPRKGKGTTHKIVDYYTASRDGSPYHETIRKYGLPNQTFRFCTRELKLRPIESYRKSVGYDKGLTAIGIRIDEMRRVVADAEAKHRIVYPLVDWMPTAKGEILHWFKQQPFDLEIPEHLGNCTWCFKKSLRKLIMVADQMPESFKFPALMEKHYSHVGPEPEERKPRKIFREYRTTADILKMARDEDERRRNADAIAIDDATRNECDESCEMYQTSLKFK